MWVIPYGTTVHSPFAATEDVPTSNSSVVNATSMGAEQGASRLGIIPRCDAECTQNLPTN